METRCPQCDTGIMLDFRFCPSCGIGLSTGDEVPEIDRRLFLGLPRRCWPRFVIWGLVMIAASFVVPVLAGTDLPRRSGMDKVIDSLGSSIEAVLVLAPVGLLLLGVFFFILGLEFALLRYGRPTKQKKS